jgi:rod shape-determining protein MreC
VLQSRSVRLISTLVLAGSAALFFLQPVRSAALTVFRLPLILLKGGVAIATSLPRLPTLVQEHEAIRAELIRQQLQVAQMREALRHARHADALAAAQGEAQGLVASVIGRSTIPTQHTVLLDRGANHGIMLDSVAVDEQGVVGRVVEIHHATALVMLLTDPESRVAGLVERSRETGLLTGRAQGGSEFVYLDVHADIEPGDRIVTAGLGGPFPKGVLLGTVTRVIRDERAGTTIAVVAAAARLGRLEELLCVPPGGPTPAPRKAPEPS